MGESLPPPAEDLLQRAGRRSSGITRQSLGGQTYTTHPGSRLLFPSLCRPTAPVSTPANVASVEPNRGLMMPRRKHTREYNRQRSIEAERKLNDEYVAERNKPPPF